MAHLIKEDYMQIIDDLRKECPDIALSSDFIIGYPGETDQDLSIIPVQTTSFTRCLVCHGAQEF